MAGRIYLKMACILKFLKYLVTVTIVCMEKKKKGTGENILADDIACTCFGILCLNGINIEKNNSLSKTTVTNGDQ